MGMNYSGWKAEKYCSCIFMKADLIRFTCAFKQNGELVDLDKYHNWLPINFSHRGSFFSENFPTCHVTTHCVSSIVLTAPSCEPVLPVSAVHQSELCPLKEEAGVGGGGGVASKTGLWLPTSKFPARPFCMSKLESTPSTCSRSCSNTSRSLWLCRQPSLHCFSSPHTDMRWTHINLRGIFCALRQGFQISM